MHIVFSTHICSTVLLPSKGKYTILHVPIHTLRFIEVRPVYNSKTTAKIQPSIEWESNLENAMTTLASITCRVGTQVTYKGRTCRTL